MAGLFVLKQRFRHARKERRDEFRGSLVQWRGEAGRAVRDGLAVEGWWPGSSPQAVLRQVSSWSCSCICDFRTLFKSMRTDRGGGAGS